VKEDAAKIKQESIARGITRLCHFTQSRKLAHIVCNPRGIMATSELRRVAPDLLDVTDNERLDGYLDHISCSIEFPNTWYFNKIKNQDPLFKEWVVLFLKPLLLWKDDTLFCCRNASSQRGSLVTGGYSGFRNLFQPEIIGAKGLNFKRTPKMLSCCPTDDQAEVLVFGNILPEDIIAVGVYSEEQAKRERVRLCLLQDAIPLNWAIVPQIFTSEWSGLVRRGSRPTETLVC
jgi:hypothetical protein